MIIDELLLGLLIHAFKGVELALEVTLERLASLNDLLHDLISLFLGDTWSKWVVGEVSANADSSGLDHLGLVFWEHWGVEGGGVHVRLVDGCGVVTVVVLDDLVEELVELDVRALGSSVNTDSRVEVLAAREDAGSERDTLVVLLIFVFIPDLLGQVLGAERLGSFWEEWQVDEVFWRVQPWTSVGPSLNWSESAFLLRGTSAGVVRATHCIDEI